LITDAGPGARLLHDNGVSPVQTLPSAGSEGALQTSDVAIATITWVRDAGEEALLARALDCLADAGMPVAVADRGASATFTTRLERLPGFRVTVPAEKGLVSQVQAAVELAASFDRPFVLYTEPDKEYFFAHRLAGFVRDAPGEPGTGVVLASRSEDSFQTFPEVQRYTESVINHLCAQLTGCPGDYSYGPFLMHRALLPQLRQLEPRLGWGWRHATFLAAHRRGLRVVQLTDDYPCPPDQRHEDDRERTHRLRQLSQNILGLIE
jgi:hypothetical protein